MYYFLTSNDMLLTDFRISLEIPSPQPLFWSSCPKGGERTVHPAPFSTHLVRYTFVTFIVISHPSWRSLEQKGEVGTVYRVNANWRYKFGSASIAPILGNRIRNYIHQVHWLITVAPFLFSCFIKMKRSPQWLESDQPHKKYFKQTTEAP